ncbi:MAG TPA: extracellular solute-binding protein [Chloroflexota bacterium]|jgi:iron(III) transport system substrate-binding protein
MSLSTKCVLRFPAAVPLLMAMAIGLSACGGSAAAPSSIPATGSSPAGGASAQLDKLIAQAKQEGELDTATTTEQASRVPQLKDAFLKRFELNLNINIALGDQTGKFAKMITALDSGGRPEFDSLTGSEEDIIQMESKGYVTKINNWDQLLRETNGWVRDGTVKPEDVSPQPFSGSAFLWSTRTKNLLYNTKQIQPDQMPKTTQDLADPRFKGKFTLPPWTDTWELGIQVHTDKEAWLQTLDQIGKNAAAVLDFSPALNRLLLGEFSFAPMNSYYYWDVKAKDPQAPLGVVWFKDYTPYSKVMYIVPKGSKHPAAATLWALWMGSPEAEAAWQPAAHEENIAFGQTDQDKLARQSLDASGTKLATWYATPETIEQLKWWSTPEGKQYRAKIKEAVTQRK